MTSFEENGDLEQSNYGGSEVRVKLSATGYTI